MRRVSSAASRACLPTLLARRCRGSTAATVEPVCVSTSCLPARGAESPGIPHPIYTTRQGMSTFTLAMTYATIKRRVQKLQEEGAIPKNLTAEERADWAYGNAVIENDDVTPEMARRAAAQLEPSHR